MAKPAPLSRNAASNLAAYACFLVISFFLAPFTLRHLGDARYGVWALIAELLGYSGLFDLGIRAAVSYYVASYAARNQGRELKESIASAFWPLSGAALIVIAISVGLASAVPHLAAARNVDPREAALATVILGCTLGLTLPMEVFQSVLVGYQRFDLANAVDVGSRIVMAASIYFALTHGGGLVALTLAQAGSRLLGWCFLAWLANRVAGGLSLSPARVRRDALRRLAGIGSKSMALNLSFLVINRTDLIVVGAFLGATWVTYYNIGRLLVDYISNAEANIARALTPRLTHLHATGRQDELRTLLLAGARVSALLSLSLVAGLAAFGRPFVEIWLGTAYVSGPWGSRSDVIMLILLAACVPRFLNSIFRQAILASGNFRYLVVVTAAEAACNLVLSLILVRWIGMAGVALGTLLPALAAYGVLVPRYAMRTFGIGFGTYVRRGVGRAILVSALASVWCTLIVTAWPPHTWPALISEVLVSGLLMMAAWWVLGLNAGERAWAAERARSICRPLRYRSASA